MTDAQEGKQFPQVAARLCMQNQACITFWITSPTSNHDSYSEVMTCCGIALMRYCANFCSWSRSRRDKDSETGARRRTCPAYITTYTTCQYPGRALSCSLWLSISIKPSEVLLNEYCGPICRSRGPISTTKAIRDTCETSRRRLEWWPIPPTGNDRGKEKTPPACLSVHRAWASRYFTHCFTELQTVN